jgi:hypothetical protein
MSDDCKDKDSLMNVKDSSTERWEVMSSKEGRVKVAHALRDKRQSNDHDAVLTRLEMRTAVHDDSSDIFKDSHYIAANAMILTVELSGNESETLIKALLCDAIDSVGVPTDAEFGLEHVVCPSLDSPEEEIAIKSPKSSRECSPEVHFSQEHMLLLSKVAERLPMKWPLSVPLPPSAVMSFDISHISEEVSQQWTPNISLLSSSALALDSLLLNNRYQM